MMMRLGKQEDKLNKVMILGIIEDFSINSVCLFNMGTMTFPDRKREDKTKARAFELSERIEGQVSSLTRNPPNTHTYQ